MKDRLYDIKDRLYEICKGVYAVVYAFGYKIWLRLDAWARKETAEALADEDNVPEVSLKRMASIIVRSIPFMMPMFLHIVAIFAMGFFLTFLFTFTGTISSDMWDNKMLVNDKLQPIQRFLIFVDKSYAYDSMESQEQLDEARRAGEKQEINEFITDPAVDREWAEYLTDDCTTFVGELKGFNPEVDLCKNQRRTVRNRMLIWFFVGELFGIVLWAFYAYYPAWVWQNVNHYLRVAMVERLEYLSLSFHHTNRSGDAIYRIYQDSSMVVNVLQEVVIGPFEDIRNLFIAFLFLLAFQPLLAFAVVLSFIPMTILTAYATPIIRRLAVANRVHNSNFTSRLQETFAALKIVKANCAEPIVLERFDVDAQKALDAALYVRFGMIALSLVVGVIGALTVIGLEYLIITWVVREEETAVPSWALVFVGFSIWNLAAYRQANGRVEQTVGTGRGFVRLWCMLQDLFIGLERAFYFLDLQPNVTNVENPQPYPRSVESVEWRNIQYYYEEEKPVLQGVNLTAEKGKITAIVGNTGSGKSTLMSLLLRLYDPQEGEVLINGTNIKQYDLEGIRHNNAIAMQKNVLFTGRVADNIAFGMDEVSREDVEAAAKVACADEFIVEMDEGYDSELGDRGSKLSSGQRQRLTIARAVVRNTPILILDEPTASLDAKTEHQVLANLSTWGEDKVVFLITHRLSTIRNADNIAFLEDGLIAETGTHDELMAVPDGRYRRFVEAEEIGLLDQDAQSGERA